MTIGEKICCLRTAAELSQEELAEKLSVSRQSVSKWEMDQALPQLDKILPLCRLFHISADTLLQPEAALPRPGHKTPGGRYFGTDGFRGEANVALTAEHAYRVGRFLGWYYAAPLSGCDRPGRRPRIVIGKDTRRSGYMLEYSIAAGITASGADAYMLHVTTTASVSYATRQEDFDCGVMITASHNPFSDNGIKLISRFGEKLDHKTTEYIEDYLDGDLHALGLTCDLPLATGERIGRIVDHVAGRNRYVGYLISLASHSYKNLRIGLDCANGAAWMMARSVFAALGAQIHVTGDTPDGLNINENCGSTHIGQLCRLVKEQHLDVGFAFDGDCDRCIAVDHTGAVVDGDKILYLLARRLQNCGMLRGDTVVATVMSNSGLIRSLAEAGIRCVLTDVGDRFVYEKMQACDYSLGGEQSGHIIMKKYATTGDGLLTAIMIAEEICGSKRSLQELTAQAVMYPQCTRSIQVHDKEAALRDPLLAEEAAKIEALLDGRGRVLLRKSGTEPVVRIMVESEKNCEDYADRLAAVLAEGGHTLD